MGLTARGSNQTFEPITAAVHVGICCGVFDLGTQDDRNFNKRVHRVLVMWELPDVQFVPQGASASEPMSRTIAKRYNLSLHKKAALRADLESWRGRNFTDQEVEAFDMKNLLGKSCLLQVIHNVHPDKVYANVKALMSLPKGTQVPKAKRAPLYFSFEDSGSVIPQDTPEWIQNQIKVSEEWVVRTSQKSGGPNDPAEAIDGETHGQDEEWAPF